MLSQRTKTKQEKIALKGEGKQSSEGRKYWAEPWKQTNKNLKL